MTALTIQPHPVLLDGYREIKADLIPGESLKAFVSRHVADLEDYEIAIDGIVVRRDLWAHVRPKHGQLIEVRSATGRSVVALIAMAALFYFTMGAGAAWIGGAFGVGATSASFIGAGLYLAGSVLINKFIAPKPPSFSGAGQMDATYNLAGQRNAFRPYEPVPLLFGRCKITPDLATDQPYTFYRGNDQYLALTLNCGINVDRVDDLYQGDALLSSFEGVETYFSGFDGLSEEAIPLYSNTDTVAGGSLDSPPNAYIERTSAADSIRLEIDLEYNIYDFTSKGDPRWNSEGVTAQYRAVGSTTWLTFDSVTLSGDRPKLKRHTLSKVVPEGQYEVRVKRNAQDTDGSGAHCEVSWVALRSIQADATNYKGLSRIGVTCKATGQLNGSLDELKCVAYSKDLEYWNGSAWVTDGTHISNPGAQVLQYARGFYDEDGALIAGMGLDDSKIDLDAIKAFILHCASNSYTYDFYLKEKRNHQQVLDAICAAGFGNITWSGGKLSVVWADSAQPLEAVANMATIKKAQFQVDYTLAGMADGIVATYLDASDWTNKEIRIAAPGVTTPLNPASIALEGITDEAKAAKMARYHLGQSLYQWKSISFGADIEHLGYQRMSLLSLSHDLTSWGASGRVQAAADNAGVVTLTLDEPVPAPGVGVTPYIGLRIPGEGPFRVFQVQAFGAETNVLTLVDAWPVDAAFPGDSADNPATDTIWVYDFSAEPGLRVRVVEVQPESDLKGAQVVVAPESDEFWTYVETGTYTPPVPSGLPASRPVASNAQAVESVIVQGNTTFSEIQVRFDITGRMDHAVILAQYTDASGNTDGIVHKVAETRTTEATFRSSGAGTYTIIVRPYSVDGVTGGSASTSLVTSVATVPSFDSFTVTEVAGGLRRFTWGYDAATIQPPDLAGAEIRYFAGSVTGINWTSMTPLAGDGFFAAPFESTLPEAGTWTFGIKARTTAGELSSVRYVEATLTNNLGEVVEQINTDLDTAKNNLQAQLDVIGAQVGDIMAADEWSSANAYDAESIVQSVGKLYRALQAVPAGIAITDTTYWELIGNYAGLGEAVSATATLATNTASELEATNTTLAAQGVRLGEAEADIATETTARADGDSALGSRLEVVEVRMPTGTGLLATALAAQEAADAAATAQATADAANLELASIGSDSVITNGEKPQVLREYNALISGQLGIDAQATAYGITTEKTNYDNALSALTAYIYPPAPHWTDGSDIAIDPVVFKGKFSDAYDTRQTLLNAIYGAAKALADSAQSTADGAASSVASLSATVQSQGDTIESHGLAITQVQADVGTAQGTADDAAAAAAAAQNSANTANTAILAISSDGVLSKGEKAGESARGAAIAAEVSGIQAQADTFAVSRVNYDNAYAALNVYLASLSPAWNDTTQDTNIVAATYASKWNDYYLQRTILLNAIAAAAKALADAAQGTADGAVTATELLDARVTATEGGVNSYYAAWTIQLDVNGYASTLSSVNDGGTANLTFNGDNFNVVAPSGNKIAWEGASGVIYARRGSNDLQLGAGFGSDADQLILYYGPSGSAASRSLASASVGITVSGKSKLAGLGGNFGSGWSSGGTISSSYDASSPATVTINVAAGTYLALGQSVSYSASSGNVSQARNTTVTYYLYYADSALTGGAKSLGISTDPNVKFNNIDYVLLGSISVNVPSAATSGTGPGGPPMCVHVDSQVLVLRDGQALRIRAGDVVVGDVLPGWGDALHTVSVSHTVAVEGVRMTDHGGHTYTCSASAQWKGLDGTRVIAAKAEGRVIQTADGVVGIVRVDRIGPIPVQHITAEDGWYLAGDTRLAYHHNVKEMV